jgi:hypothetical protein
MSEYIKTRVICAVNAEFVPVLASPPKSVRVHGFWMASQVRIVQGYYNLDTGKVEWTVE